MIEADLIVHGIGQLVSCEPTQGEGSLGLLENAAVASRDGLVVWVGPTSRWQWRLELTPQARVVDAGGGCVVPGFVDARTQPIWAGSRADEHAARLRGQPFWGGGIMRSVRLTRAAGDDELLAAAERRLASMAAHGITAAAVRTGLGLSPGAEAHQLELAQRLAADSPIRLVPALVGAHVVPEGTSGDAFVELVSSEMLQALRGSAGFFEAWCDPGAFDAEQCRRLMRRALGLGYHLKLAASLLAPGEGPRLAVEVGATSVEHLNYLRDGDARLLAESAVVCVICPGTTVNLKLASEGAARALAAAGCQLAISTDFNPGTSCTENMCLMIGLACLELGLTAEEALRAATLGGARALRLQRQCGSIRIGKRCDLAVLDAESYMEIPYRFGVNLVARVFAGGVEVGGGGSDVGRGSGVGVGTGVGVVGAPAEDIDGVGVGVASGRGGSGSEARAGLESGDQGSLAAGIRSEPL